MISFLGKLLLTLLLATLISSCAAPGLEKQRMILAGTKTCCKDVQSLPLDKPIALGLVSLAPESPHFDFGVGLAPFAGFTISPEVTQISVAVQQAVSAGLRGGDGKRYYPSVDVLFFDKNRVPISVPRPPITDTIVFDTAIRLQELSVPTGTVYVVVTTRPGDAGQPGRIRALQITLPVLGGVTNVWENYLTGIYGEVDLRASGVPAKKQ